MSDGNTLSYFSIHPNVIYTFIDDEVVLMDETEGTLYGLNAVGTEILKCLVSQPMSIQDVRDRMLEQFEVEKVQISVDIKDFFESLLAKNFIYQISK
jgi:predicted metalloprotease